MTKILFFALLAACSRTDDAEPARNEGDVGGAVEAPAPAVDEWLGTEPAPGESRDDWPGAHPMVDPAVPSMAPGLRGDNDAAPWITGGDDLLPREDGPERPEP